MLWIIQNWKTIIGAIILLIVFATGWNFGEDSVTRKWEKEKAETQKELLEVAQKHAEMIQKLEVQHDKDQTDITDYKRTHPASLYLPKTACAGLTSAVSGVQATPGKESFSSGTQQAIDHYTAGVDALMLEADLVVNDCRVAMDYLKSLRPTP